MATPLIWLTVNGCSGQQESSSIPAPGKTGLALAIDWETDIGPPSSRMQDYGGAGEDDEDDGNAGSLR